MINKDLKGLYIKYEHFKEPNLIRCLIEKDITNNKNNKDLLFISNYPNIKKSLILDKRRVEVHLQSLIKEREIFLEIGIPFKSNMIYLVDKEIESFEKTISNLDNRYNWIKYNLNINTKSNEELFKLEYECQCEDE